jgi:hypothetical protein
MERPLWLRTALGKTGTLVTAYGLAVSALDWQGRIQTIRDNYGKVAVVLTSPYLTAFAAIAGLALVALAIWKTRKPPEGPPPPPSAPGAWTQRGPLFDFENSDVKMTDTHTEGDQTQLHAKGGKVRTHRWWHRK